MPGPVNIQISHPEIRWRLKEAAAQRRQSVRTLASEVLTRWLRENGFEPGSPSPKTNPKT